MARKREDIRLLKNAIGKTDMYQPEKESGMIIYPGKIRVNGMSLNTRAQFIEEWNRQPERFRELEGGTPEVEGKCQIGRDPPMGLGGLI